MAIVELLFREDIYPIKKAPIARGFFRLNTRFLILEVQIHQRI